MALRYKRSSGITLVEMMVTAAVITLLAFLLPRIFATMTANFAAASVNLQAQDHIRLSMNHIHQALVSARRSSVVLRQQTNEPPYSQIDFVTTSDESVSIYQKNNDLIQVKDGNIFTVVKGGIRQLAFAYPVLTDDSKIQVTVTSFGQKNKLATKNLGIATNLLYLEHP